MTGAGTARSMASSEVQRPSPESTMTGAISSKPGLGPGGPLEQLEQPAAHHRAVAPDRGDLVQVERELLGRLHDLEALAVGLHEAVLDAVVHHLHEVAGPDRAHVGVPVLGGQGQEGRLDHGHGLLGAPHHEAVALLQAPHPARGAGVDEADALLGQPLGRGRRLLVVRVAAVDDDVALLEEPGQLGDGVVGRLARPGTITQAARGGDSLAASSSREAAGSAPLSAAACRASADRSKATTWWPPSSSRSVMLAPILPSPTMAIFIARPVLVGPARLELERCCALSVPRRCRAARRRTWRRSGRPRPPGWRPRRRSRCRPRPARPGWPAARLGVGVEGAGDGAVVEQGVDRLVGHGVDRVGADQACPRRGGRGRRGSWWRWRPTAAAAPGPPWPPAPPSAGPRRWPRKCW